MAAVKTTCPDCSASTSLMVAQSIAPGQLVWSESIQCAACGFTSEADGHGFPPAEIRDAIINSNGLWGLYVDLTDSDRLAVCKILRSVLKTDFADLPAIKHRIPGIVYVGTRTEMQWLQSRLAESEYESSVLEADRETLPVNIDLPLRP